MPLTLAGPTSGNARWKPSASASSLYPVLQVLERLQGEIEVVSGAARRIEHREPAQPVAERRVAPLRLLAPLGAGGRRPGGLGAFHIGGDLRLLGFPLGQQRADHDRLDQQHDLVAVGVVRAELRALARVEPALEQVPRIDGSVSDQSRSDAASTVSMSVFSSGSAGRCACRSMRV